MVDTRSLNLRDLISMLRRVMGRGVWVAVLWLIAAGAGVCADRRHTEKKAEVEVIAAHASYVGSAACSRCHAAIANQFSHASMGHSMTRVTPDFLKTLPLPASYYDTRLDHHYEVFAKDGKLFQSEWQGRADAAGTTTEVFRNTHELEWIVGTGENGFGALLRRGGYLFQAPLSYYSKPAKWDLSPGYQNGDYAFNRIIIPGCVYCHSGRPQPVAGFAGKYAEPVFTQTSVGCENCHGPGSEHVAAMGRGEEFDKGQDRTIVNPARLTEQLSDDICMGCHQTGDARVLQAGKTMQDFRPGEPLNKTVAIFEVPPTREHPPQDDHVEHYYSMSLSKCFRASKTMPEAKQMRCISCHDPHVEPTPAEAPTYFNDKCLSCHTQASCMATKEARAAASDNCTGCHMPKRDNRLISHSSATNHRIVRTPDEPFPDETFRQTTAEMPDLIHLNAVGERAAKAALPPVVVRLQAYEILKTGRPQFAESWRRTVAEAETSMPENAVVQAAAGHRDLEIRKLPEAIAHLERALKLNPLQPNVYVDLSEAEDLSGHAEESIAAAKRAVELDPFVAPLQKTLISRLIAAKRYPEAQAAMERYMALFPEDDFMRKMLAMVKEP